MSAADRPTAATVDVPGATEGVPASSAVVASAPATVRTGGPTQRFRLGNRPPLTGIRAFGIGAVLVYHSNLRTFPGAWQALGMFFTLSGFLITVLLLSEKERTNRVRLGGFYSRRAVRLLPPLLLTMVLLAIWTLVRHPFHAAARVWGDIAAAVFYFADYRSAFAHEPYFGFLAQTWSLSVEEQFYLVWAVLLVAALGTRRLQLAYGLAIGGIVVSVADRLLIVASTPHFHHATFLRTYYAFDTRADALFLGCLLGILAVDGRLNGWSAGAKRAVSALATVSAVVVLSIGIWVPLDSFSMITVWMPVAEVAWLIILVYFVVNPSGYGSRFVGLGVFVWIGNLSYTLYLLHWPVYLIIWPAPGKYWQTEAIRLVLIVGIAALSWYLMERPLMRWRRKTAP